MWRKKHILDQYDTNQNVPDKIELELLKQVTLAREKQEKDR